MKKYLVIGNPIEHSLSPKLHNYWFKENNIKATYEKKKLNENDVELLSSQSIHSDRLKNNSAALSKDEIQTILTNIY